MSIPLYPKAHLKRKRNRAKRISKCRWKVDYDLLYDGGSQQWTGYYRHIDLAHIAAWFNVHIKSWGGTAILTDRRKAH